MIKNLSYFMFMFFLFTAIGCASNQKHEIIKVDTRPYEYPFTAEMEEYHVELEVDHNEEMMLLIFEDTLDRPVKILDLHTIDGEAKLLDGSVKNVNFRPSPSLMHKRISRRLAGAYIAQHDWLKDAKIFHLKVVIPFKGKKYELSFDYDEKVSDTEIHRHRGKEY